MTTAELKQRQTAPPQPTAMKVKAHKQALIMALSALQAAGPALAMAAAMGSAESKSALAALDLKIRAIEFEIEMNDSAVALARQHDLDNETIWRAKVQELPVEQIITGLTRDSCCGFCLPGSYCAISGSVPHAAGTCSHPVLSRHLQRRDETGRRHYPYADNARSNEIYKAACKKLRLTEGE